SRRLARPARHHQRDRRLAGAGHARLPRGAGALAARGGPGGRSHRRRASAARSGRRLMRRFAELYDALDSTTSTNAKVAAMQAYFAEAPPADAAWGLFFLTGRRLKRLIAPRLLAQWGCERAAVPGWMFEECFSAAGELRVGVSDTLAIRALAQHAGLPPATVAHRMMGTWEPSAEWFAALVAPGASDADVSRPYPFFLASPLEAEPESLGDRRDWLA